MFPIYALMQHDQGRVASGFRQVLSLALFLSLPATAGLLLTADYFVLLALGPKWQPAIRVVHVMVLSGGLQVITGSGWPLYRGTGNPKLELIANAVELGVSIAVLFPLTTALGAVGTAFAVLVGRCAAIPFWWIFVRRITGLPGRDILATMMPPLVATALMATLVWAVRLATHGAISWTAFAASVVVGVASYMICLWFSWRVLKLEPLERLMEQVRPYWGRLLFARSRRV